MKGQTHMLLTREMPEIATSQKTQEVNLYRLTSTTKYFDEIGRIKVYGIEVRYGDFTERIEDISISKEVVIALLQKLEREKCSPLHLKNVVEDFVIDQSI